MMMWSNGPTRSLPKCLDSKRARQQGQETTLLEAQLGLEAFGEGARRRSRSAANGKGRVGLTRRMAETTEFVGAERLKAPPIGLAGRRA